ncbi:MAG: hypothetical protein ABI120_04980 [Gemmatimonadaceae bacterium]
MTNPTNRANTSRALLAAIALSVAAACSSKEPAPAPANASTDSIAPIAQNACAADGLWNPCNVIDRLVHAGVGVKEVEADTTRVPFLAPPGIHYQIGKNGLLIAFYFSDSVAAKKSWKALDTNRLMPKGDTISPWPGAASPIRAGNLVVAFFGSSNTQIERVSLALRAGLPAPAR